MTWWRLRLVLNLLNGSTLLGLLIALACRADLTSGPRGLVIGSGFRLAVPPNPAFTVGNVVITRRDPGWLESRPRMLAHEERHASQYAACLGLPFLPLYAAASAWSWLRGGDPAVHNLFERRAGLAAGGYPLLSARARARGGHPPSLSDVSVVGGPS